jgi:hypothetical protein
LRLSEVGDREDTEVVVSDTLIFILLVIVGDKYKTRVGFGSEGLSVVRWIFRLF